MIPDEAAARQFATDQEAFWAGPFGGHYAQRDFAGELMDKFGLRLVDCGFVCHRDNRFPQDDATWFLLEKPSIAPP